MEKIYEIVHRSRVFDEQLVVRKKLILVPLEWNDNGYYVRYRLHDGAKRVKLADLCILNLDQELGAETNFSKKILTFISDIESAYLLLLFLNPYERKILSEQLNITYDNDEVCNNMCYCRGVLKGLNGLDYLQKLSKIKEVITSPLDFTSTIQCAKERMKMMFDDDFKF